MQLGDFEPKIVNESNSQYAYRVIRKAIMNLTLEPGTIVNESALSELLCISRTPLREAIFKLKEENLFDVYPQRASAVSLIDLNLAGEGNFMRSVIESAVMHEACGNIPIAILNLLKENLGLQRMVLENTSDQIRFLELDNEFHRLIYVATGKENIWKATMRVTTHYDRLRFFDVVFGTYRLSPIYETHIDLYNILLTGDGRDVLSTVFTNHLRGYRSHLPFLLERYPHYFTKTSGNA